MKVGDLVGEIGTCDDMTRVGIVMEVGETIADVTLGRDIGAWVRWVGNTDWEIVYPDEVIVVSEGSK
jgi:hypothetical protein